MQPRLLRWCAFATAWALAGCASDHAVLATTATTIGVELSSNTTTGAPTGVLGYRRAEFAFVPTNRSRQGEAAPDADQTPPDLSQVADVLMELSYGGTLSANPVLVANLPYDPIRDFAPIGLVARSPLVLVVGTRTPFTTLAEFLAQARRAPGTVSLATPGIGSPGT